MTIDNAALTIPVDPPMIHVAGLDRQIEPIPMDAIMRPGATDPVRMSDRELIELVANHLDVEVANFSEHYVERPDTGNITIMRKQRYGGA